MKILHTSDWHLGCCLYGRKRYDELSAFLDWLFKTIENEHIDALLVAGDIFDTSTPSNRAQELYYRFLCHVSVTCCRHVVVIAGNHDSPSFLDAPKELLRCLNVFVTGTVPEYPENEVIVLRNPDNDPQAIICAVPYLRDRDLRTTEAGETMEDKNAKLVEGLTRHYAKVCSVAEQRQKGFNENGYPLVPIIAMGHLFAAGGKTIQGDGVRELYVGSLAHVGREVFPACIDYLALGHLHVSQRVGHTEHIRYSGSPIPMGFGEAGHKKHVLVVEFTSKSPSIRDIQVPCFQPIERITGSLDDILSRIQVLKEDGSWAWLEIEYSGFGVMANLRELLDESIAGSSLEIRRIKNLQMMDRVISAIHEHETLDDLNAGDVFERCLDAHNVPLQERAELLDSYFEIIQNLQDADQNAE